MKQAKQNARIEELEESIQLLNTTNEKMFSLSQQVMACIPSTHSYALFLHEQFLYFCLESIYKEIWLKLRTPFNFSIFLKSMML